MSPKHVLFAVSFSGQKIAIEHSLLQAPPEKLWERGADGKGMPPEGYPFPARLAPGTNIRAAFEADWEVFSLSHGIFELEDEKIHRSRWVNHPEIERGTVSLEGLRAEIMFLRALSDVCEKSPNFDRIPSWFHDQAKGVSILEERLRAYEPLEGWRVVFEGSLDPLSYQRSASSDLATELLDSDADADEDGFDLKEREGPGRKRAVPELARLAILAEFKRRLDDGAFRPGEKRAYVIQQAIDWAFENLRLNLKETATREVLLPILDRLPPK